MFVDKTLFIVIIGFLILVAIYYNSTGGNGMFNDSHCNAPAIAIVVVLIILAVYYLFSYKPISNEGILDDNAKNAGIIEYSTEGEDNNSNNSSNNSSEAESSQNANRKTEVATSEMYAVPDDEKYIGASNLDEIKKRSMGRDNLFFRKHHPNNPYYKHDAYKDIDSGFTKDVEKNYSVPDITRSFTDKFVPVDDDENAHATVHLNMDREEAEKNKFNVDSFLPKEYTKDWFDTIDSVNVKGAHLINIYRPIGVNTIGNTHKCASYDIRGTGDAICPQYVVSPWLQSSVQPDRSSKPLC